MPFQTLYPDVVACSWVEDPDPCELEAVELDLLQGLAPKVMDLFKMGRHAAHQALSRLGAESLAVGRGEQREPLWPAGFTGSISHTEGVALAAVASLNHVAGLGVDIEVATRDFRFPVQEKIASESEQKWIVSEPEFQRERTLALFSAKEAAFKAFYPLEKVYLNFLDVEFVPLQQGFRGILHKNAGKNWPAGFSFDVLQSGWKGYLVSALTLTTRD